MILLSLGLLTAGAISAYTRPRTRRGALPMEMAIGILVASGLLLIGLAV